jgi:hypothetical protein
MKFIFTSQEPDLMVKHLFGLGPSRMTFSRGLGPSNGRSKLRSMPKGAGKKR